MNTAIRGLIVGTCLCNLFVSASIAHAAERRAEKAPQAVEKSKAVRPAPSYMLYNAGSDEDTAVYRGWSAVESSTAIIKWGKSVGLYMDADRGPVSDGRARFVGKFGSRLEIKGLNRNAKYRLFCDFVTFRNDQKKDFAARLEVFADGILVLNMPFDKLDASKNPVAIEMPYETYQDGDVVVLFREHSQSGGFFGLWDAVLTGGDSLPATLPAKLVPVKQQKKMPVSEKVVESRPAVRKRTAPEKKAIPVPREAVKEKAEEPAGKDVRNIDRAPVKDRPADVVPPAEKKSPEKATEKARDGENPAAKDVRDSGVLKEPAAPITPKPPDAP